MKLNPGIWQCSAITMEKQKNRGIRSGSDQLKLRFVRHKRYNLDLLRNSIWAKEEEKKKTTQTRVTNFTSTGLYACKTNNERIHAQRERDTTHVGRITTKPFEQMTQTRDGIEIPNQHNTLVKTEPKKALTIRLAFGDSFARCNRDIFSFPFFFWLLFYLSLSV